jgi:hypothetical protein
MLLYLVLVSAYLFLVFRLLEQPLSEMFAENTILYALVALVLVVSQGVLLGVITAFFVRRLGLEELE